MADSLILVSKIPLMAINGPLFNGGAGQKDSWRAAA